MTLVQRRPRVVVTGSECTGKTTLARALAARFEAPWVPEASRSYAESIAVRERRELSGLDVEPIARAQLAAEDEAATQAGRLVILDTDLSSTVIYARHYYGHCPSWIDAMARQRRGDLYLFCQPDLPWVADGVRDRSAQREELNALFEAWLTALAAPVVVVAGRGKDRVAGAAAAVARLLAEAR